MNHPQTLKTKQKRNIKQYTGLIKVLTILTLLTLLITSLAWAHTPSMGTIPY